MRCWGITTGRVEAGGADRSTRIGSVSGFGLGKEGQSHSRMGSRKGSRMGSPTKGRFGDDMWDAPMFGNGVVKEHDSYEPDSGTGGGAPLVITLNVHVLPDTSDREVLEITKDVWEKVRFAAAGGSEGTGRMMGLGWGDGFDGVAEEDEGRGGKGRNVGMGGSGEVSVAVKKGWEGLEAA
jgi:hypothetical protein